ncbi:hypothetical protein PVAP13_2NG059646 [Panicum virgatum]|uniref:Uncharacterized protein n=1 Tax=Panicum virgatum TaxID=38727 RepID=A0A8T0VA70_PANVG|nr:hypothetical protein PVAP13_2NG059646 [Panicum virgatum]
MPSCWRRWCDPDRPASSVWSCGEIKAGASLQFLQQQSMRRDLMLCLLLPIAVLLSVLRRPGRPQLLPSGGSTTSRSRTPAAARGASAACVGGPAGGRDGREEGAGRRGHRHHPRRAPVVVARRRRGRRGAGVRPGGPALAAQRQAAVPPRVLVGRGGGVLFCRRPKTSGGRALFLGRCGAAFFAGARTLPWCAEDCICFTTCSRAPRRNEIHHLLASALSSPPDRETTARSARTQTVSSYRTKWSGRLRHGPTCLGHAVP